MIVVTRKATKQQQDVQQRGLLDTGCYFEVDFPETIAKKAAIVHRRKELNQYLVDARPGKTLSHETWIVLRRKEQSREEWN